MTFQEYIKQEEPKRLSEESVEIDDSWQNHGTMQIIPMLTLTYYSVVILGETYEYVQKNNDSLLWTTDEHGNPWERSVFKVPN